MFGKVNMRTRNSNVLQRIRDFLLSKKSREFLIFLFFVFVSFFFWLLQVLNDDYETEFSIPIRMKNVPDNVVVISELPSELRLGVKDRGTVLANYMLGQTFYPISLDFSDYVVKGSHVRIPSTDLIKRISSQLNQSTKVLSVKPDSLEFIYTQGKGKKIPVQIQGEVKAERQYYISEISYSPDSVMVYAPNAILDTIQVAYTEPVMVAHVSDTTRLRVDINPIRGVRFIPSHNDVTLMVDIYAEKTLDIPVRGIGFPEDKVLRTFPSKVQVSFQVGLSKFKEVTAEDFAVEVDYKDLENMTDEKCRPNLTVLSPYVNHVRMNPKEIDYIIEQHTIEP